MDIIYKSDNAVEFNSLKVGECFFAQEYGKPYMRLPDLYTAERRHYNAFSFDKNCMAVFDETAFVLPSNAGLVIRI